MRVALSRFLCGAGLLAVAAAAGASERPPYLPITGPPALRFAAPPPLPAAPAVSLPPLTVTEPPSATTGTATGNATSATQTNAANAAAPGTAPGTAAPKGAETAPLSTDTEIFVPIDVPATPMVPALPAELMTPQLFMRYFTPRTGTNAPVSAIAVPMTFIPPQPPLPPPSSTATFQTVPPGKP